MMLSKFNKDSQKSIQGYIEFLNHEGALAKAALKIEVLFSLLFYLRNLVTCVHILSFEASVKCPVIYLFICCFYFSWTTLLPVAEPFFRDSESEPNRWPERPSSGTTCTRAETPTRWPFTELAQCFTEPNGVRSSSSSLSYKSREQCTLGFVFVTKCWL